MHKLDMKNKEYVVGLDIGSSRVTLAVGLRGEGSISIIGVESQDVGSSVKDGDIFNYLELGKAITTAKQNLEQELGIRLDSTYVGVSGKSVYSVRYEDYVDVTNPTNCVRESEMRELHQRIELVTSASGDEIVERIPLRYRLDNMQEVKNPIGCYGHKLSATYLLAMISKQQINMVNQALYCAGMRIEGLCVNPTLLPEVLLTPNEAEEGVMIVDLGGDLTDIAIVRDGRLSHFSSLPIGASSIDSDLYEHLQVPRSAVERYKHLHGNAIASSVPEDTGFTVLTAGHRKRQILHRNVALITEERLKDIASFILREVKGVQYTNKIHCGVVLTGGSAYLNDIDVLFSRELKMQVRLGSVFNGIDDDSQEKVSFPNAAVVGLLNYGSKHKPCDVIPIFTQETKQPTPPAYPAPPQPAPGETNGDGGAKVNDNPQTPPTPPTPPAVAPEEPNGTTPTENPETTGDDNGNGANTPMPTDEEGGGDNSETPDQEGEGGEKSENGDATNTDNEKEEPKGESKPKTEGDKPKTEGLITRFTNFVRKTVDDLFEKNEYL